MLEVPKSDRLSVEVVHGSTTSITLRLQSQDHPDLKAFVKTTMKGDMSNSHVRLGIREVQFYRFIDTLNPEPYLNIPWCLNSRILPDKGAYFLVLEDLSSFHQDYQSMVFSKLETWQYSLRALAKFHTCWALLYQKSCGSINKTRCNIIMRCILTGWLAIIPLRNAGSITVRGSWIIFSCPSGSIPGLGGTMSAGGRPWCLPLRIFML